LRLSIALDERFQVEGRGVAVLQIKFADFFEGGLEISASFLDGALLRVIEAVAVEGEDLLVAGIDFELALGRELRCGLREEGFGVCEGRGGGDGGGAASKLPSGK
jgi:hypothetical protein